MRPRRIINHRRGLITRAVRPRNRVVGVAVGGGPDPQNFPIVYLKDSAGHVYYARSFNFSTMAPSTSGAVESADFSLPSGLPHGTYSLFVSACGVSSSTGYSFTF